MPALRPTSWPVLAALILPSCARPVAVEDLPPLDRTVEAIGVRLGRAKAPGELTAIAARGDRVLANLTGAERSSLARGAVRFRVDRPVVVDVVAPARPGPPFWLLDLGFRPTGDRLRSEDGEFAGFRREFPAGVVGLGVNALDHAARGRYAVFLRGPDGGSVRADRLDGRPWPTARADPGASPYVDASKPFDALPPSLREATLLLLEHAGRHDGALARGRVWKARQPSTPAADQVVVSFGADPARQLSVSWRTDPTVARSALRIAPAAPSGDPRPADPAAVRVVAGSARPIRSAGLLNDPVILRHAARAADLEPDTAYAYAVGDGSHGGWTPWRTVRTAPPAGRDFSFLYLGDAQNELERWGELVEGARRRHPAAGFLILAGDLVDRGNERTNWDHFFLRAAGVFASTPLMPAVGNHEYLDVGPEIYRRTFDLPPNGPPGVDPNLAYAFEYSDAFVAVLDSNLAIYDRGLARAQADWLDAALARTRATWKFVAFHHPVHASHPTRDNPTLALDWGPVFDRHGVDLVLQGHDHAYLRTHPLRAGRIMSDPAEGTTYVVAVSGEKFYGQVAKPTTARGLTHLATYQTIAVESARRRLTYRSFDRDGREVDALVIDKSPAPARVAATGAR